LETSQFSTAELPREIEEGLALKKFIEGTLDCWDWTTHEAIKNGSSKIKTSRGK